jgi:hypothetical protein
MTRPAVGTVGYRVAPNGSQPVFVNRYTGDQVSVSTPGARHKWSQKPMTIPQRDLFVTRDAARIEFRNRRSAA